MGSTSDVSRWNPRDPFADTSPRSGGKERSGTKGSQADVRAVHASREGRRVRGDVRGRGTDSGRRASGALERGADSSLPRLPSRCRWEARPVPSALGLGAVLDAGSIGSRLINARSETAAGKSAFRAAFRRRRCLVPANGWFEWRRTPAGKEPTWIRLAGGRPFSFAGLWEVWGEGESRRESFTILTCPAGEALEPVHARQPAIVVPEEYGGLAGRRNAGRAGAGAARGTVRAPAGEHADQQSAERRAGGHAAGGRVRCSLPAGGRDGCGCTWTSTSTRHPLRRQTTHSRARRAVATRPARRAERHGRAGWSRLSTCLSHQPPAADADPTVSTALNAATTCPLATRSGPGAGLASCLVGNAG